MTELGILCSRCQGIGTVPTSDIDSTPLPCAACNSTGYAKWGTVDISDLETKLDVLQADMDIIKPQIQALYDDLNP